MMDLNTISIELFDTANVKPSVIKELVELINGVYEVAESDFWKSGYLRTSSAKIEEAIRNKEIIIASYRGELVACVHVSSMGAGVSKFGMLSVPPKYEGKGIGGLLVAAAEAYAFESGSRKMKLDLLTPVVGEHLGKQILRDWYLRLGYRFIKQLPFEKAVPQEAEFLKIPCFFNLYSKELEA